MGAAMVASRALGSQPVSMNSAVRNPQAMKAPMLGMTMPLRNLPNLERRSRADIGPSFLVRAFARSMYRM